MVAHHNQTELNPGMHGRKINNVIHHIIRIKGKIILSSQWGAPAPGFQRAASEGFPGGAVVKNLPANAGDTGSSPGLGRSHMPRSN